MKLSKKDHRELNCILGDLIKAQKFIRKEDTEVCTTMLPHALSFYDKTGKGLTPINKYIGSDLCYLDNAIRKLHTLLRPEIVKTLSED